jgi:mannose-6-phosphate isomerase-like protein (cupin superfamily)
LRGFADGDVTARRKHRRVATRATPYGSVDLFHEGADLDAWWISKDAEEIDGALSVCDREDFLYVARGTLRLELQGRAPIDVESGDTFVIPANVPFRGYRWPRDGGPCVFLAVAPADATFSRL